MTALSVPMVDLLTRLGVAASDVDGLPRDGLALNIDRTGKVTMTAALVTRHRVEITARADGYFDVLYHDGGRRDAYVGLTAERVADKMPLDCPLHLRQAILRAVGCLTA